MIKKETELLKKLNKKNETLYHISSVIIFCILSVLLFVLGEPYINILTESLNGKYDVKTNAYKNEKCAFIGYECSYYYEVNGERFYYKKNTFGLNPQKIKISYEEKNP